MDKRSSAGVDAGMAHIGGRIVLKEHQIALLQVANRRDLRPFTDGGEARRAIAAGAHTAGAEREIDEAGAVEPLSRAFFRLGVGLAEHRAGD